MANTTLTIDQITYKCLDILEMASPLIRNANRQYDSEFAVKGAKIGDELRVRLPERALVHKGAVLQVDDSEEKSTTITITDQAHIGLNFTSAELALDIDDFAERKLKPRVIQLAAQIEADIFSTIYPKFYNSVGTPGTTPNTALMLLEAGQKLDEGNVDRSMRSLVVDPAANVGLVNVMTGFFNPTSTISSQFKSGLMGENVLGFDEISMGQGISSHTNGAHGTSITCTATISTQGTSELGISFTGSSKTWKAGDVFTIASVYSVNPLTRKSTGSLQQFTVTEDASGSSTATVKISPAIYTADHALATVDSFPQASAVVTMVGSASTSYAQNLFFREGAYTLATADLLLPRGVDMASRAVHNGISLRIVKQYDINNDRMPCRLDVLYGIDVLRPELGGRLWGK